MNSITSLGNGIVGAPQDATPGKVTEEVITQTPANGTAEASAAPAGLLARATRTKTQRRIKVVQRGGSSIRRQQRTEWFRTRQGWVASVYLLEDQSETYVVAEAVAEALGDLCIEGSLYGAINLVGDVFLIPVKSSDHQSATSLAEAVEMAEEDWVQSHWVKTEGRYTCDTPAEPVGDPVWPKRTWEDIFESSVKSRFIDNVEHEVIQRVLNAKV